MNSDKIFYIIVTVFTVAILFGIVFFSSKKIKQNSSKEDSKKIPLEELMGTSPHVKGNLDMAKVIVVEFGDFECPACKSAQPIVNKIYEDFSKEVAIIYRHFPLISIHKYAFEAAVASEAASLQGKFFEYHDLLYQRQRDNSNPLKKEDFIKIAKDLNLNESQFKQDFESESTKSKVQEDLDYARSLGLIGTPTFFVNGMQVNTVNLYNTVQNLVSDTKSEAN